MGARGGRGGACGPGRPARPVYPLWALSAGPSVTSFDAHSPGVRSGGRTNLCSSFTPLVSTPSPPGVREVGRRESRRGRGRQEEVQGLEKGCSEIVLRSG